MTIGGIDARVLVLGNAPSGHMDGLMGVLGGAGYRVDVRDHSDATGRLPIEAMDYDIVVLSPRALAPQPAPAAELGDVEIGRLRIDSRRRLVLVDGAPVRMSAREFTLLHHLAGLMGVADAKGQDREETDPPDDEIDGDGAGGLHACSSSTSVPQKSLG